MRSSFEIGVKLTLNLEGSATYTNDPDDPGGETKYGICKRYNPAIDVKNLTLEQAKQIYLKKYWIPAGCDNVDFPMDICLFDSQVNPQNDPKLPGGGNQEILNMKPGSWHEYNNMRMQRYTRNSKPKYKVGHVNRVLYLNQQIYEMLRNTK